MSAAATVLSSRTTLPVSTFSCRTLASRMRLIASHVSARMALMVLCSTDFFGVNDNGSRAKARNEAEFFKMKRQLLIAQLAMLLEKGAAQDRLGRQAFSPGLFNAVSAQILLRQPDQLTMLVQPLRHRLQLAADLVIGEEIEYAGLDGAFLTHCRAPAVVVSLLESVT